MSNPLQQIKAKQIAEALEKGDANPYETSASAANVAEPVLNQHNKLHQIKAKQLVETPELYEQKAGFVVSAPLIGKADQLFEQLKAAMVTDIARIKTVKVLEEKQAIKADLLPAYLPFVEQYMAQGHDYPNSVAVQVMVWLLDTNQIEAGLDLGLYLVKSGTQSLPPQFNRDIETFIADAVYDWANVQLKAKQSANPYLAQLGEVMIDDKWNVHPAVTSKTFAMLAKHAFEQGDFSLVVHFCNVAEEANPEGAGVKTMKEKALKEIDKLKENTGVAKYIRENS